MPYGLTGATQTCQRGLGKVLKHCKDRLDNYTDNCIVVSNSMEFHINNHTRLLHT